jgi:hypothetical protein
MALIALAASLLPGGSQAGAGGDQIGADFVWRFTTAMWPLTFSTGIVTLNA